LDVKVYKVKTESGDRFIKTPRCI